MSLNLTHDMPEKEARGDSRKGGTFTFLEQLDRRPSSEIDDREGNRRLSISVSSELLHLEWPSDFAEYAMYRHIRYFPSSCPA